MFDINWGIKIGKYNLGLVADIEIDESVDNLVDTATITLPEAVMNKVTNIKEEITRGMPIEIKLGYNGDLKTEFVGYVLDVRASENSTKILCEDALFLFRAGVKDAEMKPTTMAKVAQSIVSQINPDFTLVCDYDIAYEKFVIHQATGFDVLKKLAEETKANIYFNTEKKELHIHSPYLEKGGTVIYSMQVNVEKSALEYKKAIDRKVEVVVESTNIKGKVESYTAGTTGGDKVTLKVGAISPSDLPKIADSELLRRSADMYEGAIDTWLIPFVKPTYSAKIKDEDYPEKDGTYYVVGVVTSVSEAGCKRTVKLGVKLSV